MPNKKSKIEDCRCNYQEAIKYLNPNKRYDSNY